MILKSIHPKTRLIALGIAAVVLIFYAGFVRPPNAFPTHHFINIEEGTSIRSAAHQLEEERVISSSFFFTLVADIGGKGIRSGTYTFEAPLSVFSVWYRLATGNVGTSAVFVTIPEGTPAREMADIFKRELPGFNREVFLELATPKEGYLFPETYALVPGTSEEAIVALMEQTFLEKIATIEDQVVAFGKPLSEVVIMASIVEKEARLYETRQKVAGILWKRLSIDMPLQVDAVFGYILGKETFNPSFDDLHIESPYNTYRNLGLPPGPINSPGLEAIEATINPIESPYLYYLTGSDGTMHYAKTFEQHVTNRRFLR